MMPYQIRPMRKEDLEQVVAIDHEAFPTQWPPTNYRSELQNRLAHYVVAYREITPRLGETGALFASAGWPARWFGGWWPRRKPKTNYPLVDQVVGFAGCWVMAEETHVTEIAVRHSHRHQGVGELLLIAMIEMGIDLRANLATLEVRVSNTVAQKLYEKYGFEKVGLRKGYYTDNREDALIMTIPDIRSAAFQQRLALLKQRLARQWGVAALPVLQGESVVKSSGLPR